MKIFIAAFAYVFCSSLAYAGQCKIDDLIASKVVVVPSQATRVPLELARKFHLDTNIKVDAAKSLFLYSVRISNGYEYKGFTTCGCATLMSDDFELFSVGGVWGISEAAGVKGSRIRNESIVETVDTKVLQAANSVKVSVGWCPRGGIGVDLGEVAKKAMIGAALAYISGTPTP